MRQLLTLLLATLCAATSYGQTMKALAYNMTNGVVTYNSTNNLTFTTSANFTADVFASAFETGSGTNFTQLTPDGLQFGHAGIAATTRTNLSLGLPALTNTSNVTMMRALSGSTNTNHPFSGSVSVVGTNNTNTLVFSNGILQSVQ
jgi:hypothetical protein